jgi:hypothetical protein
MKGLHLSKSPNLGSSSDRNEALHSIFAGEDHILWFQRFSQVRIHILISVSSNSLKSHFRAWAHAYVLARLAPVRQNGSRIHQEEIDQVSHALKIVNTAFEQGTGIERALQNKGWDIERSMMAAHIDGKGSWKSVVTDDKQGEKLR